MPDRSRDWLMQAERDLAHAERSRVAEDHEWACFAAQQAAEKALKALHYRAMQEVRGHVLTRLLDNLPPGLRPPQALIEKARVLDSYYVAPRYPNSHAAGAPAEHYGPLQSEQAISYAREIVEFARAQMA